MVCWCKVYLLLLYLVYDVLYIVVIYNKVKVFRFYGFTFYYLSPFVGIRINVYIWIVRYEPFTVNVLKEATGHGWCQYNKGLERAMRLTIPPRDPDHPPTVRILWGEPGVGKSLSAYQAGAAKCKWRDPFCIGYTGQRKVVFDDFNPGQMTRTDFLNITDRYPLQVEVKGDSIEWSPEEIWFTSNYDPEAWKFKDGEEWDGACARRCEIIYKARV